jgi:hypothetical protein
MNISGAYNVVLFYFFNFDKIRCNVQISRKCNNKLFSLNKLKVQLLNMHSPRIFELNYTDHLN